MSKDWREKVDFLSIGTPVFQGEGVVHHGKCTGNSVLCGKYQARGKLWELTERVKKTY